MAPRCVWMLAEKWKEHTAQLNRTIPLEQWNKIRWIECINWVKTGKFSTLIRQIYSFNIFSWISVNGCQTIQIKKIGNVKLQTLKHKQKRKINKNVECLILKSWLIFSKEKKSIHSFVNCKFWFVKPHNEMYTFTYSYMV